MREQSQDKRMLLRTPQYKIPIGVPIKRDDGTYMLRIKKPNGREVEDVTLDDLVGMMIKGAESKRDAPT